MIHVRIFSFWQRYFPGRKGILTLALSAVLIVSCSEESTRIDITYQDDQLRFIQCPLGGIGTGNILMNGYGAISELEIFGHPAVDGIPPEQTFFSLWTKPFGGVAEAHILEGEFLDEYPDPFGKPPQQLGGIPRFRRAAMTNAYPVVRYELSDEEVPLTARLIAWSPYIPVDEWNSGIPAAILEWTLENPTKDTVEYSIAFCMANPFSTKAGHQVQGCHTLPYSMGDHRGMYFSSPEGDSLESGAGEMVVMTPVRASLSIPFGRKGRHSNAQDFWYDFSVDGTLEILSDTARNTLDWSDTGALYSHGILVPGEEVTVPFIVCWHVPFREYESGMAKGRIADGGIKIKNHYATEFHDVQDVTDHVSAHIRSLRDKTFTFSDVMINSSVPKDVLDAAISNLSSLKTNLLMRDERGRIRGYIGLDNDAGCCPGLCQPAWNYAQSMAAVFPSLERNAVNECFTGTFQQDPMPREGIILRVYREWKMSGDNAWLGMMWQKVRNALPGKPEEAPGSRGTLYLGALKAYAEMAMVMNAPQ